MAISRQESQRDCIPGNGKRMQTEAEKEISRLQKELADARMEREILKKTRCVFSSSDRKNMRS